MLELIFTKNPIETVKHSFRFEQHKSDGIQGIRPFFTENQLESHQSSNYKCQLLAFVR